MVQKTKNTHSPRVFFHREIEELKIKAINKRREESLKR